MFRLMMLLFSFLVSSAWRPSEAGGSSEATPPEDNEDGKPQGESDEKPDNKDDDKDQFTAAVEHEVGKRLERERRRQEREREEAERKARENALKEQEDWKKLAEERTNTIEANDKRIKELEGAESERDSLNERVQALEAQLKGVMEDKVAAVPELYRPFVEDMSVEKQAEWLKQNAEKLNVTAPNGSPHVPPADRQQTEERDKEARERDAQRRRTALR